MDKVLFLRLGPRIGRSRRLLVLLRRVLLVSRQSPYLVRGPRIDSWLPLRQPVAENSLVVQGGHLGTALDGFGQVGDVLGGDAASLLVGFGVGRHGASAGGGGRSWVLVGAGRNLKAEEEKRDRTIQSYCVAYCNLLLTFRILNILRLRN